MKKDKAKYWVIASGSIEYHLMNYAVYPLSNKCASKLIPADNIILSHYNGFHFKRKDNNISKAIYIFDDETAYDDCCKSIEERYGFMNDIEQLGNSFQRYPIETNNAIYTVENIYRLYTEENINELLPSWYQHFHNALNTLKNCGITDGTIRQYIETGDFLNEQLSDFKLHQTNDLDIVSGKCWRNYYDYANYQAEDKDELMEYSLVKTKFSGLCVDLYADDGGAYKRHKHPLWAYFRNGIKKTDNVLPISVDDNPQLLICNHKINISENIYKDICNFIKSNKDLLIDFANDQLGHKEFFDRLKPLNK